MCGDKECLHAAGFSWRRFHFPNQWLVFLSPHLFLGFWRVARRQLAGNGHDNSDGKPETTRRRRRCRKKGAECDPPSRFRPPYCPPDLANEFRLTASVPGVAAWCRRLSGLRGHGGCEVPSVVPLVLSDSARSGSTGRGARREATKRGPTGGCWSRPLTPLDFFWRRI